ncbi:hypothetical protein ACFLSY_05990 [Bacteroidota bacterium]
MILEVLKIRLYQSKRIALEIGVFRAIVLLIIITLASVIVFNTASRIDKTIITLIINGLIILAIHTIRKDKSFLAKTFKRFFLIFFVEYFIVSLPIILIFIFYQNFIGLACLILIILIISLIRLIIKPETILSNYKFIVPLSDPYAFELISGIRKNYIFLIPIYLFFLIFSFREYVVVIGMLVLSLIISGFYFWGESREFIESFADSPRKFIFKKVGVNYKHLLIFYSPLLIISLVFNIHTWIYLLGGLLLSLLIQLLTIIFKYGLFEENTDLGQNSIIVYGNILFLFLPFFWPAPIIMGIKYYYKACKNLQRYCDVNN